MDQKEIDFSFFYSFLNSYKKLIFIIFIITLFLGYFSKNYIFNYLTKSDEIYINFKIFPITSKEVSLYSRHNAIIEDIAKLNSANIKFFENIIFEIKNNNIFLQIPDNTAVRKMEIDTEAFYKLINKENLLENFYEYLQNPHKLDIKENLQKFVQTWELELENELKYLSVLVPLSNHLDKTDFLSDQKNLIFETIETASTQVINDISFRSKIFVELNEKRIDQSIDLTELYFKNISRFDDDMYLKITNFNDLNKKLLEIYSEDIKSNLTNTENLRVVSYNQNLLYELIEHPIKKYFNIVIILFSLFVAILFSALTGLVRYYIVK